MPRFQLEIAIALAVSALTSIVAFYLCRSKDRKIQLPTTNGEDAELELEGSDPFDVAQPIDLVDGFPIDEEAYWSRVRPCLTLDAPYLMCPG